MRFRIWTILWVFALFASAMATFGGAGIYTTVAVLGFWLLVFEGRSSRLVSWLVTCAFVGFLIALLLPAVQGAREASRRSSCMNNMKNLALALLVYEDSQGRLPTTTVEGPDGQPWHSWRLEICPYMYHQAIFDYYKKDEPWNGPKNSKLLTAATFEMYECPTHGKEFPHTSYYAVVGEQTAWPKNGGRAVKDFKDGLDNTILLIEAPSLSKHWAEPVDLSFDEAIELLTNPPSHEQFGHTAGNGFFYKPSTAINVAFADGSVRWLELPIARQDAVALLTIDGGEKIDPDNIRSLANPELDYARIYSLSVFIVLSLLPVFKLGRRRSKAIHLSTQPQ